jgi:hypothetical protein
MVKLTQKIKTYQKLIKLTLDNEIPISIINISDGVNPRATALDSSPILVIQYRVDSSRGLAFWSTPDLFLVPHAKETS